MKRKLLFGFASLVLLMFALGTTAFAAELNSTGEQNQYTDDTIITEDNIYEVVDFLGLDADSVVNNESGKTYDYPTVGELKAAIEEGKNTPQQLNTIIDQPQTSLDENEEIVNPMATRAALPIKTVTAYEKLTNNCTFKVSATGSYYASSASRWWDTAISSNVDVSGGFGGYYTIEKNHGITIRCVNAGASNSYLKVNYNVDIAFYTGVGKLAVKTNEFNNTGYTSFYANDYL